MHFAGGVFPPPSALTESMNSTASHRGGEKWKLARMRHFGLATFLVWREFGDDFHRAVPKVSAVYFPKSENIMKPLTNISKTKLAYRRSSLSSISGAEQK